MYVYMYVYYVSMPGALGGQARTLYPPLGLELLKIVSCHVGARNHMPASSPRVAGAL